MIFVTLGSQKFQFDRLLREIDRLIEKGIITDSVFAQKGHSSYLPKNYKFVDFLDRDEFAKYMEQTSVVITHAGTGAIIGAVKKKKKVIAIPRREKYGEHVDDHQLQIVEQFDALGIIEPCYEVEQLEKAYTLALSKEYKEYISNTKTIVNDIMNYLES